MKKVSPFFWQKEGRDNDSCDWNLIIECLFRLFGIDWKWYRNTSYIFCVQYSEVNPMGTSIYTTTLVIYIFPKTKLGGGKVGNCTSICFNINCTLYSEYDGILSPFNILTIYGKAFEVEIWDFLEKQEMLIFIAILITINTTDGDLSLFNFSQIPYFQLLYNNI